jgi:hypothetical protein
MKTVFIGHFSPSSLCLEEASSPAGNQVQRQILHELIQGCGLDRVTCFSMCPQPFWPKGRLYFRSIVEDSIEFLGYPNLPVIKHLVFALRLFVRLIMLRPKICLQYNSYLLESLTLILYRTIRRRSSIAIIIQDIHVASGVKMLSKAGLRVLVERISLRLARRFNMIVPISSAIVVDFNLPLSNSFVFQGGITEFATRIMSEGQQDLAEIAVFAGGLESHNGIDRLVDEWLVGGIAHTLHVFGRGSLAKHVEQAALQSDRIVFHGFQSEEVILSWQRLARWNFCLRYSVGLNQSYFFPSKLFNILCAPGTVVVNDFHGIPTSIRPYLCIVADDLSDLAERLPASSMLSSPHSVFARRQIVCTQHSWRSCVTQLIRALSRDASH